MKLNSLFYLSAVTLLFLFEAVHPSFAMQTGNKRSRSDATNWGQGVFVDSKFELLKSIPRAIFKDMMGDLVEQEQTCAGVTCKVFLKEDDSYRVHAKRSAIVVPADKQYQNLRSFIKYLYKYSRIKLPAASRSSQNDPGDSKSTGNGSESKTKDIGSFITQINLGLLRPEPSQSGSAPDASVEDVLKAIQTIFPDLQELHLANADLQESELGVIGQMKNLRVLDLGGTSFYHPGIRHLSNLTEMRRLNLSAPGTAPSDFDPTAQFSYLSKMHHLMYLDFTQSPQTARAFQEWILSVTDDKNGFAAYRRAVMLDYGTDDHKGPPVDSKLAIAAYEKAAQLGHPLAQTRLAKIHKKGTGVKKDHTQAHTWFKKAYRQGHAEAREGHWKTRFSRLTPEELAIKHATLLRYPEPVQGSRKEHFNYQLDLGWMYLNGLGITKNVDQALFWLLKAAEKGLAGAQNTLGFMYCDEPKVSQDHSRAAAWFQKAAEQGLVSAQYNLAMAYELGQGVVQNFIQAMGLYQIAAEQGMAEAQHELARLYYSGPGVTQNHARAKEWFQKAAEQGLAEAQHELAKLYYSELGGTRNYVRAKEWFQKAAEQGLAKAQSAMGYLYEKGLGVEQDYSQAVDWYRKAARQHLASAQFNLGTMYDRGLGVNPDREEAIRWYRVAAAQGHEGARARLNVLEHEANTGAL